MGADTIGTTMMEVLLALFALTLIGMLWAFSKIEHVRSQLKQTRDRLGSHLPPHLVDEILQRRDNRPMAMIHTHVTVVVFRIRNFSNLIERHEAATALRYLNECYLLCGTAVNRNGGTIERLLEDGVVAVFGFSKEEAPDHEFRGLRAALEAARLVSAMASRWETDGRRPLRVAVGVHAGPIVAGEVGFGDRRAFALVGSTVTVAHELQDVCEDINATVVASAAVYKPVESRFVALPVKQVPLRCSMELRDTFVIRGLSLDEPNEELTLPTTAPLVTTVEVFDPPEPEEPEPPIARRISNEIMRRVSPAVQDASYRESDSTAIVPDPLWPSTYEDDNGPPVHVSY
jgi:class 3 adenylate cyclase